LKNSGNDLCRSNNSNENLAEDLGLPVRKGSSASSLEEEDQYNNTSFEFARLKAQRSRLLEMLSLQDQDQEAEDDISYLCHNSDPSKFHGDLAINEIVDIIPLAGVIPAGHTQTFSVVFYGHPNITFETTAYCFIEGGTGKTIKIKGSSIDVSFAS
jgi:hypothetical protein